MTRTSNIPSLSADRITTACRVRRIGSALLVTAGLAVLFSPIDSDLGKLACSSAVAAQVDDGGAGPHGRPGFAEVDFRAIKVGGEWGDRRDLQLKNVLTWYPVSRDKNRTNPLDFEKEILDALWVRRVPAKEMLQSPNFYTGLGKSLDALVHFAAELNSPELLRQKDWLVATVLRSQDEDGYFGTIYKASPPGAELWQVWNLHDGVYLALALVNHFRLFGHQPSLDGARRYADYVMHHWPSAPTRPGVLSPIGISEMLLALSSATGERRYRDFGATTPFDGRFIDREPLVEWRQSLYPTRSAADDSKGSPAKAKVHTYRYFARLIEQLDLFRESQRNDLFTMSRYTLAKLADPESAGLFVTGAVGRDEGWVEDQVGKGGLGEGCAVVHAVWWLSRLIEADGDLSYGDMVERMIYNHLEAQQDPHTGQTRYFCPVSGQRSFFKGAHCCDGNFKRFWAKLGGLIYFTSPGGIAVSQYCSSTASLKVKGELVVVSQKTDYPATGEVHLTVALQDPMEFELRLRIPRWAESATVTVNNVAHESVAVPGGRSIRRRWSSGDKITLILPLVPRWVTGMRYYEGYSALVRGPRVFCLSSGKNPNLVAVSNWRDITVDPDSFTLRSGIERDGARRPVEAIMRGWTPGRSVDGLPDLALVFSDFPVTDGRETYVKLSVPARAVRDELYDEPDGRVRLAPAEIAGSPDPY